MAGSSPRPPHPRPGVAEPATSPLPGPDGHPPAGQVVPGNRWDLLDVAPLDGPLPRLHVSVVIPHYQAPAALERTLASLAAQTYPRELTEVIVVDDGSDPPLAPPRTIDGLEVRLLHRPDEGFTLAGARHEGALTACGEVLVFLDADMLCEPEHLAAHARWHHACDHAVTLGARQHVPFPTAELAADGTPPPSRTAAGHAAAGHAAAGRGAVGHAAVAAGHGAPASPAPPTPEQVYAAATQGSLAPLFAGQPARAPEWLDRHLARTDQLTTDHDDLFRVVAGGNLGVRRDRYLEVGGFDPTFTQWGSEDTDLGHRLFLAGALLVPEPRAACWHQGDSQGLEPAERRSLAEQRARISQTIAHPHFRRMAPGRTFRVPYLVVEVTVGTANRPAMLATVESVLASDLSDLAVELRLPSDHPEAERLRRELLGDGRVRVAPADAMPTRAGTWPTPAAMTGDDLWAWAPYRCSLDAGVLLAPGSLRALVTASGEGAIDAGLVTVACPTAPAGGVELRATRAVGRARLAGATTPEQLRASVGRWFGARALDADALGLRYDAEVELRRLRTVAQPPAATPTTPGTGAAGDAAAGSSRVAAWQLLDGPVGWQDRRAVAQRINAAESRAAEADHRAAEARKATRAARADLERVRARRILRVTDEVARTGRSRSLPSLPARLRAALTAPPAAGRSSPPPGRTPPAADRTPTAAGRSSPPPGRTPAGQPVTDVGSPEAAETQAATTAPPPPHRDALPGLRVLHLGALCRFGTLATHTTLTPGTWRAAVAGGADVLVVEPPPDTPGWDPLDGELAALLHAARGAGIPSARIHTGTADPEAPGAADLEVVETALAVTTTAAQHLRPTVDSTTFNPQGWTHRPPDGVVAVLGRRPDRRAQRLLDDLDPTPTLLVPPDLRSGLPAELLTLTGGVARARTTASPARLARGLRRGGVLLDHPGWRRDDDDRWRGWVAALACGTPVVAVDAPEELVPPPGVVTVDTTEVADTVHGLLVDAAGRERLGIAGRRFALDSADRRSGLVALLTHLDVPLPAPLTTTVLLATHRPDQLDHALASVRRQRRGGVDVSLVLHGAAFDGIDVGDHGVPLAQVVRAPDSWGLGDCLNAALDGAGGQLVTKMDDDDHYGPEHLGDLVLAWRHSGAEVVGKRIEFIHLADRDLTLRRTPSPPERDRPHVGGPTLLAARDTLRRYGFLRLPRRVDSTLYERVLADGGRIYGTHSRDVVLSRRGDGHGHAWEVADEELLAGAVDTTPGLDLAAASSDPQPPG